MTYYNIKVEFEVGTINSKGIEGVKTKKFTYTTDAYSTAQAEAQVKAHLAANEAGNVTWEVTGVNQSQTHELVLSDKFQPETSFIAEELAELSMS